MTQLAHPPVDLPVPVLERAHWRIVIRPHEWREHRIASHADAWRAVQEAAVGARGWPFPWVPSEAAQEWRCQGSDWIGAWDAGARPEYWRLYLSGQFVALLALEEFRPPADDLMRIGARGPAGFHPSGFVDFGDALMTLVEAFEFAARLVRAGVLDSTVHIEAGLRNIRDHLLVSSDRRIWWSGYYRSPSETLERSWDVPALELASATEPLAVAAAAWLFGGFGWLPGSELLASTVERIRSRAAQMLG